MSRLLAALVAACVLAPAHASDVRHRSAQEFVVVHDIRRPGDREDVQQRLAEHVGEDVQVRWVHVDDLSGLWPAARVHLKGADAQGCSGSAADAQQVMQLGERAFGLLGLGRTREALRKASAAEARWACLEEYVPASTLQRSALASAWVAHRQGDRRAMERHLRQAVALSPSLPQYAAEELPGEVQEAFFDAARERRGARTTRLVVTVAGAPVEAYVDGEMLAGNMGSGGVESADVDLAPGRHLVQFVGSGPHAESISFEVGSSGGELRLEKITPVKANEVLQVFERSLSRGDMVALLGGLIRAHPDGASARRVVLARADRRFEQTQLLLLPVNRTPEGDFVTDAGLYSALEVTLDEESQPAATGVTREQVRTQPGRWRLRTGVGGGPAFVNGFVYGSIALDLSIESPVLVGLDIRPEVAFTQDSDHAFTLGGGSAHLVFCPRFKRVRFDAGVGMVLRSPDHRFVGTRVHPSIEMGFGVRPVGSLWLMLRGEVTVRKVYDAALRLSLTYEFDLRPRRP